MRRWHKYWLEAGRGGTQVLPIDRSPADHEQTMGGYGVDEAYRDKHAFFRAYFFGYHLRRLEYYEAFLRKHLRKEDEVLSLGSGRAACELRLIDEGYRIICSDLQVWGAVEAVKSLFPNLHYIQHDIMQGPAPTRYDAILCLGISYLLNAQELRTALQHIADSVRPGGRVILEASGLPDTLLGTLFDDVFLQCEVLGARWYRRVIKGQRERLVVKHHGYRWNEREILQAASERGLVLRDQEGYASSITLRKSRLFNKLIAAQPQVERVANALFRWPYIRMYLFERAP